MRLDKELYTDFESSDAQKVVVRSGRLCYCIHNVPEVCLYLRSIPIWTLGDSAGLTGTVACTEAVGQGGKGTGAAGKSSGQGRSGL